MNIKKTLLISGIICLAFTAFSGVMLAIGIYIGDLLAREIVVEGICIGISLFTSIAYIYFSTKSSDYIVQKRNWFFILVVLNIFNSFVIWIIAFIIEISVNNFIRQLAFKNFYGNEQQSQTKIEPEPNYSTGKKDTIILDLNDYRVVDKIEIIRRELNKLDEQLQNNEITQEEYDKLRNEILNRE